jgi:hypothetical protein
MNAEIASQLRAHTRASGRARAVVALGPLTALAGVGWALAQPYRLTLLDPLGHGFWDVAVQPPLLVILVGVLFACLVAPGLVSDLASTEEEGGR